jgi:hypothetical protein
MLRTIRQQRKTAMHHTSQPLAAPEAIRALIDREYPELTGGPISISLLGNRYRVIVKDVAHLSHTIHIPVDALR